MPFVINQTTAEILDKNSFILELWHKSNTEDELLGVTKLDLFPIIDSLRINEDTLSIIPISRNLQPLIIYDGNYPVYNFDTFSNIYYLDLCMAVGTTAQVNNYIKKNYKNPKINQSNYESGYINKKKTFSENYDYSNINNMNTNKNLNQRYKNSFLNQETEKKQSLNYNDSENRLFENQNKYQVYQDNENNNIGYAANNQYQDDNNENSDNKDRVSNIKNNKFQNEINEEEIFEINTLMNNNFKNNPQNKDKLGNINKFDVEKFLENNRLELDNINNVNYNANQIQKNKNNSANIQENKIYTHNQYENPFIVNTNTNANNNTNLNLSELPNKYENNKVYQISKESNFYIDNKDKENQNNKENNLKLNKLSDTEFFKTGKNLLKSIENNDINPEFDNDNFKIEGGYLHDMSKINDNQITKNNSLKNINLNNVDNNSDIPYSPENDLYKKINNLNIKENKNRDITNSNKSNLTRHTFEINIEKLINLQILNKITKNRPFLKYKFFNDSEYVKSDILYYSEYEKETSTVIVDMKTSHSSVIKKSDKIRDLLNDLEILFIYQNENKDSTEKDSEIIFGRANLPVEELQDLILNVNNNTNSNNRSTLFIYGTEKINREDCIIGKLKIVLNYNKQNLIENENENILYEKQTIYSRKIAKNSCLILKLNYFKYNDNFIKNYEYNSEKNNYFYFEIDPFYDDKTLKNVKFIF